MYSYHSARVKTLGERGRWRSQDLSATPVCQLLTDFAEVVLWVTHPLYPEPLKVWIREIPVTWGLQFTTKTVSLWLTEFGSLSLPTTDWEPSLEVIYAPFRDAFQAGYSVATVEPGSHPDHYALPEARRDLRITKPETDYSDLFRKALVTVNGLFHRTNYTGDSLNVIEGHHSARHANCFHVGLYFLGALGNLTTVPLCDRFIFSEGEGQPLKDRVVLEVDPRAGDLEGKSILLSISGYLHLPGTGLVTRTGDRHYTVNLTDYPWVQRFFELRQWIDTAKVEQHLTHSTVNKSQVATSELFSDEVIRAVFTLSQSFFVIVDTPEIWLEETLVEWNQLPGSFISYEKPEYPLVVGLGRFQEYWTSRERDRHVLSIQSNLKPNYLFETTPWKDPTNISVDNSREPANLITPTEAFFFKLGKNLS